MAGFKRTVTVSCNLVTSVCDATATSKPKGDEGFVLLCDDGHPPARPRFDAYCKQCSSFRPRTSLVKGAEVAKDTYVVFSADEVAAMQEGEERYKGVLTLIPQPADEVTRQTVPSGKTYYLAPSKRDQFYGVLRRMIADSPDLAFLGLWTITSRASLYRVTPFGDGLVATQLLRPQDLAPQPPIETPAMPEEMLEMANQLARQFTATFEPASYASSYSARLATAVRGRDAHQVGAPLSTAVPGTDPMAAMLATMQEALADKQQTETPTKARSSRKKAKAS